MLHSCTTIVKIFFTPYVFLPIPTPFSGLWRLFLLAERNCWAYLPSTTVDSFQGTENIFTWTRFEDSFFRVCDLCSCNLPAEIKTSILAMLICRTYFQTAFEPSNHTRRHENLNVTWCMPSVAVSEYTYARTYSQFQFYIGYRIVIWHAKSRMYRSVNVTHRSWYQPQIHQHHSIVTFPQVLFHNGSLLHSKRNTQQPITISNSCRTLERGTYRNTTANYNPSNGSTGF
jgi:hypothetical protein